MQLNINIGFTNRVRNLEKKPVARFYIEFLTEEGKILYMQIAFF